MIPRDIPPTVLPYPTHHSVGVRLCVCLCVCELYAIVDLENATYHRKTATHHKQAYST